MRAWPESDKTCWFQPIRKPARSGLYEVEWESAFNKGVIEIGYAYWDDKQRLWGWTCKDADRAMLSCSMGANQRKRWRGLNKEQA